jgi:protein tyrosine phosphatase (PTP) superfamily phosphohydrolase (DUF442 family)
VSEQRINSILNYLEVSKQLGTGGQPQSSAFASLAAAGYQVVINLGMPHSEEAVSDEDWLVTEQGMTYVHLPVPWEKPTAEHVARFFAMMEVFGDKRIFVHCIMNMRVSVFVYLYRVCREGIAPEVAQATMLRIWEPSEQWQSLIEAVLDDGVLCHARVP